MTAQKKRRTDWSDINTLDDLHREQRRLRAHIRLQETELRLRVKQVPAEALRAAANAVVPRFLEHRLRSAGIDLGQRLVSLLFARKHRQQDGENGNEASSQDGPSQKSALWGAALKTGLFALLKVGFNALAKKK